MKYEKPQADVVMFDGDEFMVSSIGNNSNSLVNGYCGSYVFSGTLGADQGYSCTDYTQGSSCALFNNNVWSCSVYRNNSCETVTWKSTGHTETNYSQDCYHF